jgi:hypothetical protein
MRISEVVRSLCAGCVVYAATLACSSAGGDGGNVTGTDTGGVTGMNGNGGSSGGALGTGSVANAQTGGEPGGTVCDCPVVEPPVEVTVDCLASYQTQLWAELTITGVTAGEAASISFFSFSANGNDLVGTPTGYKSATSSVIAHKTDTVAVQCWGNKATFVLPAALADRVVQ